jgi:glycosyltransferase involved in cell wall biosynthesis
MKILLCANTSWYLYNFRFHLLKTLVSSGYDVHLLSPPDEFTQFLTDAGFNWHSFPISRKGMNPIKEIITIIALKKMYGQIQPKIVFHFTPKCVLYGSAVAKSLRIPKIVNTITGLGYLFSLPKTKFPIIRAIIRLFYRYSLGGSNVIFQNPDDLAEFIDRKIIQKEQGILISGSGVNIDRFIPKEESTGIPIVILLSRLIKEKGIFEFVEASRLLRSRKIEARFVLVGQIDEGNPSTITVNQINQWVEEGVVEWWGWRNDPEKVFQQSSLVCLPSYYREGTPKSLIEAAASGRAIIASDTPGCREIVRNNHNGLLIQPKNSLILAEAIQKLLLDPDLRTKMGRNGREMVEKGFQNPLITIEIMKAAGL